MRSKAILTVVLFVTLLGLTGCTSQYGLRHRTSVIEFLYPDKDKPVVVEAVPKLKLPMTVGIAFVPAQQGTQVTRLSEAENLRLMDRIAKEFEGIQFIEKIERIPTAYLSPKGGFDNLDQLRTMYGIDAIALLSVDQLQNTSEGALTLLYWTIVGAYIVEGEKNDTNTMLDAAVFHIPSRQLLFRAPGLSRVKGSATVINLSEQLNLDAAKGFELAADELVVNLKTELDRFKEKVKSSPQKYEVLEKNPATGEYQRGGGALDLAFSGLILLIAAMAVPTGKK